ncbi:TIGR03936 family radical SAM-associated protein [Lachnobacterium bovis]|uniref:Radical SAM-linked protein n=1 Tax=Lachnobacterium bovis TaxID=140626 RepID=A0A1H9QQT0_9FIRM|nr:TIGR03936 family radical SAM-associated protein [Lachnobacterium bovis]SER62770.1 radical SAM-linked protein [Lachnobacterium bovis]
MRIRIKFRKYGAMKFIGHLDMMRYFQKAVRRAEIDICYSEGFSPHQIMSFAAPLGVGITSDGEYLDIEVNSTYSTKEALERLNATMVEGVEVLDYVELFENAKKAMSIVASASYTLSYKRGFESPFPVDEWKKVIKEKFKDQRSFIIIKKTKKSEKEMDLKPLVEQFDVYEKDGQISFDIKVTTGSTNNVKPELVLQSIYKELNLEYDTDAIQIHRKEVFAFNDKEELVPLIAFGREIL